MNTIAKYLHDMLERISRIENVAAEGKATFDSSFMHQDTIIRNYEVLGAIVKRLPDDLLAAVPKANWAQLKGFRDFLAHNYDRVDLKVVWDAVEQLPILRAAVESMLADLPQDDE